MSSETVADCYMYGCAHWFVVYYQAIAARWQSLICCQKFMPFVLTQLVYQALLPQSSSVTMHPELKLYLKNQVDIWNRYHLFESDHDFFKFINMFVDKLISKEDRLKKKKVNVFVYFKIYTDSLDFVFETEWQGRRICVKGVGVKSREEIRKLWIKIQDSTIEFDWQVRYHSFIHDHKFIASQFSACSRIHERKTERSALSRVHAKFMFQSRIKKYPLWSIDLCQQTLFVSERLILAMSEKSAVAAVAPPRGTTLPTLARGWGFFRKVSELKRENTPILTRIVNLFWWCRTFIDFDPALLLKSARWIFSMGKWRQRWRVNFIDLDLPR